MTDTLPVLHLDLETRSTVDLPKSGPYVYAEHPTTDVWVACWAIDDEPVQAWAPGAPAPDRLRAHIEAGLPVAAHNYAFEYVIVNQVLAPRHGWPALTVEQGICTAAMASAMALPRSLDQAAAAVGLDIGKDMAGRRLMLQMSRPRRVENDGTIVWWDQDFEKMARLVAYCVQDVEVERQLAKRLRPLSRKETEVFRLDLRMNSRGVQVDRGLVEAAQQAAGRIQQRLHGELYDVTRGAVTRTTKVQDLLEWVRRRGVQTENLDKYAIAAALDDPDLPADVVRALRIRQEAGKSSTSKYKAFVDRTSADGRLRDNLMYHGASTGRWSGRGVQLQNLPRPALKAKHIQQAIEDVMSADVVDRLEMFYPSPMQALSDLVRSCLVAKPGHDLIFADFNAIEARVLAWLAGQEDLLHLFQTDGDAYLDMAAEIYNLDVARMTKDTHPGERQLGKTAVLGCGYGMGRPKFRDTCAKVGVTITQELADRAVDAYRGKNAAIVDFWYRMEEAAVAAVRYGGVRQCRGVAFQVNGSFLRMRLPSGRLLYYAYPKFGEFARADGKTKSECLTFMGVNSLTKKWERQDTYGGKLVENCTQAVARDLMAEAMLRLDAAGYPLVLSVHDEVIAEAPEAFGSTDDFIRIMTETPAWAAGCPVRAEGVRSKRYRK